MTAALRDTAQRLAGWLGTVAIDRRGTPGGDTDGWYVPAGREHYLLQVVSAHLVNVVRGEVGAPDGRWVTAASRPPEDWTTSNADDDETYVTITPAGARVAHSNRYHDDAAIAVRVPLECCRRFLALERSRDERLHLLIERHLGASVGSFGATPGAKLAAEIEDAVAVLATIQ